jgi:hypothetical protein
MKYICSYLERISTCCKILPHGADNFTSFRRKACCGYLSPSKPTSSVGFEATNIGSNCKHAYHYITEDSITLWLIPPLCSSNNIHIFGTAHCLKKPVFDMHDVSGLGFTHVYRWLSFYCQNCAIYFNISGDGWGRARDSYVLQL